MINKRDIILITVALGCFLLFFLASNNTKVDSNADAIVIYNNEKLAEISLAKDGDYVFGISGEIHELKEYDAEAFKNTDYKEYNRFSIRNGSLSMTAASCPDKLCCKMKPITARGEIIVCLPHRFYIKLLSGKKGGLDAISE